MSKPGQFLITLSGARPDILALVPGEKIRFQSLGWVIMITSGMAVVSMWFALTSALGVRAIAALPLALLWGLVIMGIDRWLVNSLPSHGQRRVLMATPRLVLAILLGGLISTPLTLRVFESEINNQISVIQQNNEASFLSSQQQSSVQGQVTKWQNTVNNLEKVINTQGGSPLNPGSDSVVLALTAQLKSERSTATQDYDAWQCQLYGGSGCSAPKGDGQLAQASEQRYDADEGQIGVLASEISAREKTLADNSAAAQQTRLQQANEALPNAKAQLASAQAEETSLLNNFQQTNKSTNGLLIRLQALDQLTDKGGSLALVRWLLFLLFLVIEVLPVMVKLLQQPGPYEEIVEAVDRQQVRRAKWIARSSGGPAPAGVEPGGAADPADYGLQPSPRDLGFAARRFEPDLTKADLMRLFGRTQTQFTTSRDRAPDGDKPEPRSFREPAADAQAPSMLDEDLLNLADARPGAEFGERFGREDAADDTIPRRTTEIERRWSEDEL
jgi:hypothetical protein